MTKKKTKIEIPKVKQVSSRTTYRKIRRQLIKDCIMDLVNLLDLRDKYLETIHLPFFKKLKRTIENRHFEENEG